ncbi:hypothetical protein LTR66_000388 [Elasticomyces elasticus]|nr:hypothetical protein LTR66_000388 [Elasticomyces elasticus]
MSSAALQAVQQQSRQYQQASPIRDAFLPQPIPPLSSSPASSRKQWSSGHGVSPGTPRQPQYNSPAGLSNSATPRGQPPAPSSPAPLADQAATSAYEQYYNPPGPITSASVAPPPRTSSYQRATASSTAPHDDEPSSSRAAQKYSSEYGSGGDIDPIRDDAPNTVATTQARQRAQSPRESPQQQSSSSGARHASTHGRSSNAVESGLPRENSTTINRLVITDPQEDVEREQVRLAEAKPQPPGADVTAVAGLGLVGSEGVDDGGRGAHQRSRQEHLKGQTRKETKFGEYFLGQTLGEGEFGKVKMGWKKEGGVQVAIKLIRRESLGSNPSRLPKIYREIAILRQLQHPNIVRLHEMVETERHIGIILEYASGGELFDYILNHRYLKDNAARRLFAQLVSGVGYLHKKGIVHRDLKLENLLLDRNKNIIITDFGFANTFNPHDELGEEIEYSLASKDFVKKMHLDHVREDGHRRGDLMQTSCGSPCYAAPELVVSDSLYTGRKVDVWSCGVILYAMLAGYLPFDDDPANPEGDNINLLYKYIVSTPLTFPEYVTPHARDLLRRILVPDPRKRADLFEVARHSWLSEFAHVVGFITSSITSTNDIANTTVPSEEYETTHLARSASVREPTKPTQPVSLGGLLSKHAPLDQDGQIERPRGQRDNKRRTVQVEYVAPQSQTVRGEGPLATQITPVAPSAGRSRARPESQGPIEVTPTQASYQASTAASRSQQRSSATQSSMPPPSRPGREPPRSVSDSTALTAQYAPPTTTTRSSTRDSLGNSRLPSRGNSYSQPLAAQVAPTNAQGRFSQPKSGYIIAGHIPQQEHALVDDSIGRPSTQRPPSSGFDQTPITAPAPGRGHKRTSTVGSITEKLFGRSNSVRRNSQQEQVQGRPPREKPNRAYPPVSMKNPIPNEGEAGHRPSSESRRTSFGFSRKNSDNQVPQSNRSSRRFSWLPGSLSMKSFNNMEREVKVQSGSENRRESTQPSSRSRQPQSQPSRQMAFGRGESRSPSQSTTGSTIPLYYDSKIDAPRKIDAAPASRGGGPVTSNLQYQQTQPEMQRQPYQTHGPAPQQQYNGHNRATNNFQYQNRPNQQNRPHTPSQSQESHGTQSTAQPAPNHPQGFGGHDVSNRQAGTALQKNRKFGDAYEHNINQHAGSSGGARRVMDWFRKRGRERAS